MKNSLLIKPLFAMAAVLMLFLCNNGYAENIDPDEDGSQWAWGENVGWLNFEPSQGPGVTVSDTDLTGYVWQENIGWISLSCENTSSCGTVDYGVENDGNGLLSGYAWGENVGWISFSCENTDSCSTVSYQVYIDPNGYFNGWAWVENIGWIHFNSTSPVAYKVQSEWTGTVTLCLADFNGNQRVGTGDVGILIEEWATMDCDPDNKTKCCRADANGNGRVGTGDVGIIIEEWMRMDCPYRTPPCTGF